MPLLASNGGMRHFLAGLGLVLLVAGLVTVKVTQISTLMKVGKEAEKAGPPPEAVSTLVSQEQTWEGTLSAIGTVAAVKGVAVSNDASGIVARIHFESGDRVRQGQVLVELDTSVERAQLASARARGELALLTVNRSRALLESRTIAPSQVDDDEAQLKTATADVNALQAQINRKVVRAPFSGRLGIRAINLGQYLDPGTTITVLEAIDALYVDFTLPQERLASVKVGMPVRVMVERTTGAVSNGVITAIDPVLDSVMRSIKVRASVPNKDEKLRSGMFAIVSVVLPESSRIVTVPATAIVHASYGDSVFVVEDRKDTTGAPVTAPDGKPLKVARQQFVRVGEGRGDFVAILEGVKAGEELVSTGAFKLRNGATIVVHNDIQPVPQLTPRPENR